MSLLAVISPAKTLDYESQCPNVDVTIPDFLDESAELINTLKKASPEDLRELMHISEKLAELNHTRYQEWTRPFTEDNARPALLAFKGDVYTGFDLASYGKRDYAFAQKTLRILSGLYGLLRPLDLMQPYRLEMGTKLKNENGADLYAFWDTKITEAINTTMAENKAKTLVNLASNEYFKSVDSAQIDADIVTPVFKDEKNGKLKIISFYAKKARGMMCDYIIRERIKKADDLKGFSAEGYQFDESLSEGNTLMFTRPEQK